MASAPMLRADCLPFLAFALGCSGSGNGTPVAPSGEPGRPRSFERADDRNRLVDHLARRGIRDAAVLRAMRDVPRHWFVPDPLDRSAYDDEALPIGEGQTISQPFVVALMTEALALTPESRVLEVGTGSGYQAAVLSELCAEVWTIEIVPALAARAEATFREHGYERIRVRLGDGWQGWASEAPFDAVMVTASPGRVPEQLFEQLAPGGRMCVPVGPDSSSQELLLVRKNADGSRSIESIGAVRFVPMTGGDGSDR